MGTVSTGWGALEGGTADGGRQGRRWEAPRTAYRLAAEFAGELAGRGGAGQLPAIGKAWHDLTTLEQHDVMAALAAQARAAIWQVTRQGTPLIVDLPVIDGWRDLCQTARAAVTDMVRAEPAAWQLPQCGHCAAICAHILCAVQCGAFGAMGFTAEAIAAELAAVAGAAVLPVYVPVPRAS